MKTKYRTTLILLWMLFLTGCGGQSYFEEQTALQETETVAEQSETTGSGKTKSVPEVTEKENPVGEALQTESSTAESEAQSIYVDLSGAVNRPGVYEAAYGSRLFQVIEQAGGLTGQADVSSINRAAEVRDGEKIYIYSIGEERLPEDVQTTAGAGASGGTDSMAVSGAGGAKEAFLPDGRLDLNTATKEQLLNLPGIGEQKAEAILSYREEHGGFSSPDEIKNISGIKEGVYRKIQDQIGVR